MIPVIEFEPDKPEVHKFLLVSIDMSDNKSDEKAQRKQKEVDINEGIDETEKKHKAQEEMHQFCIESRLQRLTLKDVFAP